MSQRYWKDINVGDAIPEIAFPLSIYRLVVAAGANRDFNSHHHNSEYAKSTGAPDMYANMMFLMSMWEVAVRGFIGLDGQIHKLEGFRMGAFNPVGETVTVKGEVNRKWEEDGKQYIAIKVWSENSRGTSVGPGHMIASLPVRSSD